MNILFLSCSALFFSVLIYCGIHYFPRERWQMIASIPAVKKEGDTWHGINFTYYGFVIATASVLSLLFALILLRSASVSPAGVMGVIAMVMTICIPAAGFMARIVEKKPYTFTIGGAFFCGITVLPLCMAAMNLVLELLNRQSPAYTPVLAAMAIAYILGEGLGRLGCISFGCCYGKPLRDCRRSTRRLYDKIALVFHGKTKKAVYESALAGEKLIPVQAMTCILYTFTALVSAMLFLYGLHSAAFLLSLYVSQIWRIYSETLRADFRGFGKISAYQKMSLLTLPYGTAIIFFLGGDPGAGLPVIARGVSVLAEPLPMITLQCLWLLLFIRFGRSNVTTSTVHFEVVNEHI